MRAALYARVSTEGQDPTGQKLRLYDYAKLQGWEVFDYYEDKASGKDDSRPDLDRMMGDAGIRREGPRVRPKFGVILVTKLDRMMRSLVNMENIVKDLESQNVGLIAFDQGIDTLHEDPSRKMVRRMISSVAEWEREIIVIRVVEGVGKAQRVGTRSGRPFGRPVRGTELKGKKKKAVTEGELRVIFAEDPRILDKGSVRKVRDSSIYPLRLSRPLRGCR